MTQNKDDELYRQASIASIKSILKSRGWRLPIISYEQTEQLISRLKNNSSPDFYGLTSEHIKNGGATAIFFLQKYINFSFQFIEHGVPEEDMLGTATMAHKGKGKELTDPKSFRIITVCAILGKLKEMAICDLCIPIQRSLKPKSQLGFTAGLMVKAANVLVTKKRGFALKNDEVVLFQFLDASMAFDKTLIPIMLKIAFQSGLDDDKWRYWENMHAHSKKAIKWKGQKSELFEEQQGVRQGSTGAADEYKGYTVKMLSSLESLGDSSSNSGLNGTALGPVPIGGRDTLANHPTSVVAVADDTAPSSRHALPRVALSDMQTLLYVTEDEARQLHIDFNVQKCQLLISARPGKMRKTLDLLKDERVC